MSPLSAREKSCTSLPGRGDGEVLLGLAMPARAKRASHIDPPKSPSAIVRRASLYREENREPGKEVQGSEDKSNVELDPGPGIRERPRPNADSVQVLNPFCKSAVQLGDCHVRCSKRALWPRAARQTGSLRPNSLPRRGGAEQSQYELTRHGEARLRNEPLPGWLCRLPSICSR